MTVTTVSSIWLVPSAADTERLQPIIHEIAAQQGGVSFQPHLTLGSLHTRTPDLPGLSRQLSALHLMPVEIDATNIFTTALFIRFETSTEIKRLRTELERQESFRASRVFDPHMSLCYGPPPPGLDDLERYSELLSQPILFDQVCAVKITVPVVSYDDVRAWHIIEKCAL